MCFVFVCVFVYVRIHLQAVRASYACVRTSIDYLCYKHCNTCNNHLLICMCARMHADMHVYSAYTGVSIIALRKDQITSTTNASSCMLIALHLFITPIQITVITSLGFSHSTGPLLYVSFVACWKSNRSSTL